MIANQTRIQTDVKLYENTLRHVAIVQGTSSEGYSLQKVFLRVSDVFNKAVQDCRELVASR